jgi:hypothetical protein
MGRLQVIPGSSGLIFQFIEREPMIRDGKSFAWLIGMAMVFTGCMTEDNGVAGKDPVGTIDAGLPLLFTARTPEGEAVRTFPEEKRIRMAEIDQAMTVDGGSLLSGSPQFVLNLFEDVRLVAQTDRREILEAGRFTLNGRLAGVDGSYFTLAYNQGAVSMTVHHPVRGHFEIEPTGGLLGKISEFAANRQPLLNHAMIYPDGIIHVHGDSAPSAQEPPSMLSAPAQLDFMVVYTAAAAAGSGGVTAMRARIDKAVLETNDAFVNSQINAKLVLVHAAQIDYAESGNMGTDLGRLQKTTDGYLDNVHALRTTYKADLVSLIVEQAGGIAGIGYVMTSVGSGFKSWAFTVVGRAYTGSGRTVAHELGHNLGCAHDRLNSTSQAAYPYSYGYRFYGTNGVQYRTIMAYSPGTPIPYFSNPNLMYMGAAIGIPDGQANSADNARTINITAPITQNFFIGSASTNMPPVPTIATPAAGATYMGGTTLTFSGTGADTENGALPASAFTWQVDLLHDTHSHPAMAATSGITSGSYAIPNRGETSANVWYRVTLTVKDAAGLTASTYRDVQPVKANITLSANQAGLQLKLDGAAVTSPYTFTGVAGMIRSLEAVSPQTAGTSDWTFANWSDGGARIHEITTPGTNAVYTANFTGSPATTPTWSHQDIGAVGLAGGFAISGGTFTVKGAGADIWNYADGFHFGYQTLGGNGMITARVVSLTNTNTWAKAGVMIRESTAAGSRHAMMAMSFSSGRAFQRREATNGVSTHIGATGAAPYWVRMVRSGTSLKGYTSTDGVNWTLLGESVQSLPVNVLIGLAVSSHTTALVNTSVFDNVSIVKLP